MKKFLIIGNMNAIQYKEIIPLIKDSHIWIGVSFNKSKWFKVPDDYKKMDNVSGYKEENGEKYILVKSIAWFTNMEHNKRNEPLMLTKKYDPALYPKYDNYDAINIDKVKDIPMDYDGLMGVPITFLGQYCPTQFEIIGVFKHYKPETSNIEQGQIYGTPVKVATIKSLYRGPVVNGKCTYYRILIKKNNRINKNEECMKK